MNVNDSDFNRMQCKCQGLAVRLCFNDAGLSIRVVCPVNPTTMQYCPYSEKWIAIRTIQYESQKRFNPVSTLTLVFFFFILSTRDAIWMVESVSVKLLAIAEMCAIMVVRQFMFPRDSRSSIVSLLSLPQRNRTMFQNPI